MTKTDRIDRILLRHGWATESQIAAGLARQKRQGGRLGSNLATLGHITEKQLADALAEQFGTATWDPETANPDRQAIDLFPAAWIKQKRFIPLALDRPAATLTIGAADPQDAGLIEEIRAQSGVKSIVVHAAPEITLRRLWDAAFPQPTMATTPNSRSILPDDFSQAVAGKAPTSPPPFVPPPRVIVCLANRQYSKTVRALLESEGCAVIMWDGRSPLTGQWDILLVDEDAATLHKAALESLPRSHPRMRLRPWSPFRQTLADPPISYGTWRDAYLKLAETGVGRIDPSGESSAFLAAHCVRALAPQLPLTALEVDTLVAACLLAPLIDTTARSGVVDESADKELNCPFPIIEIFNRAPERFDGLRVAPGESRPECPFAARVYAVVHAYVHAASHHPHDSLAAVGALADALRAESGKRLDPLAVEALIRVLGEDALHDFLPPGPMEVMLVGDDRSNWGPLPHLLEESGWRVVVLCDPAEARTLAGRRSPDALVWAAEGHMDWISWQRRNVPTAAAFLMVREFDDGSAHEALEAGFEDVWSARWDPAVIVTKLQRAVRSRTPRPTKPVAMAGTLEHFSLIDLVQILAAGARSVRVDFREGLRTGTVILWRGQIKFAQADGVSGEEAIYTILTWRHATFSFTPVETPPTPNCSLPNEAILLEGCRTLDERRNASQAAPASPAPASIP